MRKLGYGLIGLVFGLLISSALANYVIRDGNNVLQTVFSFVCQSTVICPAQVIIDSTGTEKFTNANPGVVTTNFALATAGGWTTKYIHALTNLAQTVKAGAGQLGFVQCDNVTNSFAYVQIFNVAAGSVVLGSTVPSQTLPIPANLSNGFVIAPVGLQYNTAISVAATTTDNGAAAPATALNCTFGFN